LCIIAGRGYARFSSCHITADAKKVDVHQLRKKVSAIMVKHHNGYLKSLARVTMALAGPIVVLAFASSAMAEPQGIFKIFNQCPTEVEGVTLCSVDKTTSGEFVLGTSKVPINREIIQQGGFIPTGNPEIPREFYGVPAKNGETLSKTELNVPGGLAGLINCEEISSEGLVNATIRALCKETLEKGVTAVTATTELVANAKNPVIFSEFQLSRGEGPAVILPLRVHLKNPFLGKSCYIGSEASPLELHLTDGETHPPAGFTPLHGKKGTPETLEENELPSIRLTENTLVDNTFPSPGTEGCGELLLLKGFLDSLIDTKLKIPNSAGENTAILNGELRAAGAKEVVESESF
jgi:hypothetical protein